MEQFLLTLSEKISRWGKSIVKFFISKIGPRRSSRHEEFIFGSFKFSTVAFEALLIRKKLCYRSIGRKFQTALLQLDI